MISAEQFSRMVASIYASAERPEVWSEFLEMAANALEVDVVLLLVAEWTAPQASIVASVRVDPEYLRLYRDHWSLHDVWINSNQELALAEGAVYCGQQLIADEAVKTSPFYNDFLRQMNLGQLLAANLTAKDNRTASLACNFSLAREPATREQLATLKLMVPHLQRSLSLHRVLQGMRTTEEVLTGVLDHRSVGFVMADATGRVLRTNHEAERIFRAQDGLSMKNGRLSARTPAESQQLQQLVRQVGATANGKGLYSGGALRIPRPSQATPYSVMVIPIHPDGDLSQRHKASVVLLISDPDRTPPSRPAMLQTLFGLTKAEATIALALASGQRPSEIADTLCISQNTLRTHLKRLYDKTGTHGQAGLLRLLLRSPAALWED